MIITNSPTKKGKGGLNRQRDKNTFVNVRFEVRQVVGFWEGRAKQHAL